VRALLGLLFDTEDGGSMLLGNVRKLLPDCMAVTSQKIVLLFRKLVSDIYYSLRDLFAITRLPGYYKDTEHVSPLSIYYYLPIISQFYSSFSCKVKSISTLNYWPSSAWISI
jgi:hypothetical protein